MRLIELHILQSFPVSCLNRDDVGAPKTAVFGGVTRARISSQCLKRAIRLSMKEHCPDLCQGERSKLIVDPLASSIQSQFRNSAGLTRTLGSNLQPAAGFFARSFCNALATYDEQAEAEKGVRKVKTLMFLSPGERAKAAEVICKTLEDAIPQSSRELPEWLASALSPNADPQPDKPSGSTSRGKKKNGQKQHGKEIERIIKRAAASIKDAQLLDAGDIALFGRMVASDTSLNVEGAAMFSHALSTHRADNDIDFYTAVDDRQQEDPTVADEDRAGSGMMGTLEFTSATYYRYAAVNLDLLADEAHLAAMSPEGRKRLLDAFIRSTLLAVPSARRNSMNACTLPACVLGIYRSMGHPLQLVNAFEEPVRADGAGYARKSREAMEKELENLKNNWGVKPDLELWLPSRDGQLDLEQFCHRLAQYA